MPCGRERGLQNVDWGAGVYKIGLGTRGLQNVPFGGEGVYKMWLGEQGSTKFGLGPGVYTKMWLGGRKGVFRM